MVSTIEGTLKYAVFLAKHLNKCDLQCGVIAVLLELGISAKWNGFDYLERAILLFSENPTQSFTKEIYPIIGKSYTPRYSGYQVEISIRRSINEAWKSRDNEVWSYFFPVDRNGNVAKPSNGEFIAQIARFLELWQGCKEGCYEIE